MCGSQILTLCACDADVFVQHHACAYVSQYLCIGYSVYTKPVAGQDGKPQPMTDDTVHLPYCEGLEVISSRDVQESPVLLKEGMDAAVGAQRLPFLSFRNPSSVLCASNHWCCLGDTKPGARVDSAPVGKDGQYPSGNKNFGQKPQRLSALISPYHLLFARNIRSQVCISISFRFPAESCLTVLSRCLSFQFAARMSTWKTSPQGDKPPHV